MSWSRAFHVPIITPDGLTLRTLRDAGEYMQALPIAKLKQPEWEIAAEMVLAAVEGSGPLMFAEIAMRKALKPPLHQHRVAGRRNDRRPAGQAIVDVLPSPNHNHGENDRGRNTGDGCLS